MLRMYLADELSVVSFKSRVVRAVGEVERVGQRRGLFRSLPEDFARLREREPVEDVRHALQDGARDDAVDAQAGGVGIRGKERETRVRSRAGFHDGRGGGAR
jgi:hypothetical protein